ncbi:MAG: Uma2 family endonuclease [Caldilineaceae bacterium]
MTVVERQVTTEEFEAFLQLPENQDRLFELIHGEIVEKMPTEEHGVIVINLGIAIGVFVKQYKLGRVGAEIRYKLPKDRRNSRIPDLSFNSGQRPVVREGSVPQMPELAVEIKSPTDTIKQLREKADYYLANGAHLVWLVFPGKRYVEVYTPDGEMEVMFGDDLLNGGNVLPGFTMPVADVFEGV